MDLVSMKRSPAEMKEGATPEEYKPSEYPYGLKLDLNDESLKSLRITKLPDIGEGMMLVAKVEVCNISAYDSSEGGASRSMGLQITDMALKPEEPAVSAAEALYGKKA